MLTVPILIPLPTQAVLFFTDDLSPRVSEFREILFGGFLLLLFGDCVGISMCSFMAIFVMRDSLRRRLNLSVEVEGLWSLVLFLFKLGLHFNGFSGCLHHFDFCLLPIAWRIFG